jgi:hypothetical protein
MYYYQIIDRPKVEKDAQELKRLLNRKYLSGLVIDELKYIILPKHLKKYFIPGEK